MILAAIKKGAEAPFLYSVDLTIKGRYRHSR